MWGSRGVRDTSRAPVAATAPDAGNPRDPSTVQKQGPDRPLRRIMLHSLRHTAARCFAWPQSDELAVLG
jgi:hypothetical protein